MNRRDVTGEITMRDIDAAIAAIVMPQFFIADREALRSIRRMICGIRRQKGRNRSRSVRRRRR